MMKLHLFLAIAAAGIGAAPGSAQSVRSGIEAWQRGDHSAAVAAWRPLAGKGDADAAFNLGQAYRLGKGVPIDLARAQALFEQAARAGHAEAATVLGILLFQNGNRTAGLRWLKKGADGGDPRAMLLYGTALFNGDGVAPDPVRAYAFVSRASAQGLPAAGATLADLDATLSLDQRRKGVALAKSMVSPGKTPAPGSTPKPAEAPTPATSLKASGSWRIQLGAFAQRSGAEALFSKVSGRLAGRQAFYVPAGKVIRLQAGPFESRAAAQAACGRLAGQACFPVQAR